MIKHITIYKGLYQVCGIEYPIMRLDGSPVEVSYNGPAFVEGNRINIENGRTEVVSFLISDTPTYESVQYDAGRQHALRQQRRREPKNVSSQYWYGWYNTWEDKKRGSI